MTLRTLFSRLNMESTRDRKLPMNLSEQIQQLAIAAGKLSADADDAILAHERAVLVARKIREKLLPVGLSQQHPFGLIADLGRIQQRLERIEQDANSPIVVFRDPDHVFHQAVHVVNSVTSGRVNVRAVGNRTTVAYDFSGNAINSWAGDTGIDIRATFGIDSDVLTGSFQLGYVYDVALQMAWNYWK